MARAFRWRKTEAHTLTDSGAIAEVANSGKDGLLASTSRWLARWRRDVPTGYEDDTGFHFGAPSSSACSQASQDLSGNCTA